tara:strand:+ start:5138 stop:5350 length:213 start_codon:yes stop_codon:yes gene_type:complete
MDEIMIIVKKYNSKLSEHDVLCIAENVMELVFNHGLDTDSDDDNDSVVGDISELDDIQVGTTSDGFHYLK